MVSRAKKRYVTRKRTTIYNQTTANSELTLLEANYMSSSAEICRFCYRAFRTLPGLRVHLANNTICHESFEAEQRGRDMADRLSYQDGLDQGSGGVSSDVELAADILDVPFDLDATTEAEPSPPASATDAADTIFRQPASTINVIHSVPQSFDDLEDSILGLGDDMSDDDDHSTDEEGLSDLVPHLDGVAAQSRLSPSQAEVDGATTSAGIGGSTAFHRFTQKGAAKCYDLDADVAGNDPDIPKVSDFERRRQNEDPNRLTAWR